MNADEDITRYEQEGPQRAIREEVAFTKGRIIVRGKLVTRGGKAKRAAISSLHIFRTRQKLYEAARRGHGLKDIASARSLDEAIAIGRGGIWLDLTDEQYSSVKMTLKCNQTAA